MVLGKNHGEFLQLPAAVMASLGPVLRDVAEKHEAMLGDREGSKATRAALRAALISVTSDSHRQSAEDSSETSVALRGLKAALNPYAGSEMIADVPVKFAARVLAHRAHESSSMSFVQKGTQPAGAGESYAPASGQILGILKQMKEEFETNLASSQKEEVKGQEEYA